MANKINTIFLADRNDSLIEKLASRIQQEIYLWLTPQDILNHVKISDTIDRFGNPTSSWTYDCTTVFLKDVSHFINRIDYFSPDLFKDFIDEDQMYAQTEFTSYLIHALATAKNCLNKSHPLSPCGYQPSLIEQYCDAQNLGLQTPKQCQTSIWEEAMQFVAENHWKIVLRKDPSPSKKFKLIAEEEKNWLKEIKTSYYCLIQKIFGEPIFVINVKGQCFATSWQDKAKPKKHDLPCKLKEKIMSLSSSYHLGFSEIKLVKTKNNYFFEYLSPMPQIEFHQPFENEICETIFQDGETT